MRVVNYSLKRNLDLRSIYETRQRETRLVPMPTRIIDSWRGPPEPLANILDQMEMAQTKKGEGRLSCGLTLGQAR